MTLVTWSGSECFLHSSFSFIRLYSQVCGCALSPLGLLGFAGTPTISLLSHTSKHWNYNEVLVFLHRGCLSQGPFHSQPHWRTPYPHTIHHPSYHFHPQLQHFEHWTKKTVSWSWKMLKWKIDFLQKVETNTLPPIFGQPLTNPTPSTPHLLQVHHRGQLYSLPIFEKKCKEWCTEIVTSWDCYVCFPDFSCLDWHPQDL